MMPAPACSKSGCAPTALLTFSSIITALLAEKNGGQALRAASGACRVVLCLITENWLGSSECFHEFGTAWGMGKRIIPLFLLPPSSNLDPEAQLRLERVCGEDQGIDLTPCINGSGALPIDADRERREPL